jgi:hypothetical protein
MHVTPANQPVKGVLLTQNGKFKNSCGKRFFEKSPYITRKN